MNAKKSVSHLVAGLVNLAGLLRKFLKDFCSDEVCLEFLFRRALKKGQLRCRHCGSRHLHRLPETRRAKCSDCNNSTWFTVGTIFERVRHVQWWCFAIWLMERGYMPSSSGFAKITGIAQSTALNILQKLRIIVANQMYERSVGVGCQEFRLVVRKRSQLTVAGAHPISELQEQDDLASSAETKESSSSTGIKSDQALGEFPLYKGSLGQVRGEELSSTRSEDEQLVLSVVTQKPVDLGQIIELTGLPVSKVSAILTMLELSEDVVRLFGDRYKLRVLDEKVEVSNLSASLKACIEEAIDLIIDSFHGVSRMKLQLYLGAVWCCLDRTIWCQDSLFGLCWGSLPISDKEVRDYLSPKIVLTYCP
jgi:hypothetical protein